MIGIGRLYTVPFVAVSIAAVQDLFNLAPAANKPIWLEQIKLSNVGGNADAGDAQEELLRIEVIRMTATVTNGSGGAAVTPVPTQPGDAAAGFTARCNDTTLATTSGVATTVDPDGLNIRIPTPFLPVPEHRIGCAATSQLIVRLNTAPADAVLVNGVAYVREMP